jgi:hypothetical protein
VKSLKTSNNKGDNFKVENGGIYKIFEDEITKVQYRKM